ncbi:hypothetical protein P3575_24275, partial [Vibrio parahaemolyticus]|nr:hypothetical protein [Vibrio parahaemolyticus]
SNSITLKALPMLLPEKSKSFFLHFKVLLSILLFLLGNGPQGAKPTFFVSKIKVMDHLPFTEI